MGSLAMRQGSWKFSGELKRDDSFATGPSVLGFAHNRVVGLTFRVEPNQAIKRGQFGVSKSCDSSRASEAGQKD
jgi:hypothetical protein